MRIIYWSSDVCSSDLRIPSSIEPGRKLVTPENRCGWVDASSGSSNNCPDSSARTLLRASRSTEMQKHSRLSSSCSEMRSGARSEEHTSELQSLMRISYAVFCLKKKHNKIQQQKN